MGNSGSAEMTIISSLRMNFNSCIMLLFRGRYESPCMQDFITLHGISIDNFIKFSCAILCLVTQVHQNFKSFPPIPFDFCVGQIQKKFDMQ